jgi:hypothetical protein
MDTALKVYQSELNRWRDWLDRSLDFWTGAWLAEQPERTCASEAEARSAALGKKIWLLATRPPAERSTEAFDDIAIRIDAQQAALGLCEGRSALETINLRLLRSLLGAFKEGLDGLKADDDGQIRRAMESEQRLAARAMRCRQEHENRSPSPDCTP